jgi:phosphoglycerate dehydrogenase-like enzyme
MQTITILDDYQGVALASADWSAVTARAHVRVITQHIAEADELVAKLHDSDIVVAMRERTAFSASVLRRLPRLKLLVTTGMRNASIDVEAAHALGITVSGTSGGGSAVPEMTMGMIIALTRHFVEEDARMRVGGWQHTIGPGLAGRTLGIVGLGRLGIPVASLAQAFAMEVIAWSPRLTSERAGEHGVRAVAKAALFDEADVVTIHMPLSERSRGIIGADELRRLGPSSYLVNTSRGPIVDEAALVAALATGAIAGAALDVYDTEPLPATHPLRSAPHTLLLPHIGYVTTDAYRVFFGDVVENIVEYLNGRVVRAL